MTTTLEVTEETVRETLTEVVDPELYMNIIELGLVYKIDLITADNATEEEKKRKEEAGTLDVPDIEVEMTLTSPACPYGPMIMGQVPTVLKSKFDKQIGEVNVSLSFSPPWDPATMASEDVKFELGIF